MTNSLKDYLINTYFFSVKENLCEWYKEKRNKFTMSLGVQSRRISLLAYNQKLNYTKLLLQEYKYIDLGNEIHILAKKLSKKELKKVENIFKKNLSCKNLIFYEENNLENMLFKKLQEKYDWTIQKLTEMGYHQLVVNKDGIELHELVFNDEYHSILELEFLTTLFDVSLTKVITTNVNLSKKLKDETEIPEDYEIKFY